MHKNLIAAIVLITLGVLFLLNNLGYTNLSLGRLITTWWPVVLILVGIQLLLRDRDRPRD
jgi:uncharacterized membrane protein YhhN